MAGSVLFDGFSVTPDAGLELMAHHLLLAHKFFEIISPNKIETEHEVARIMTAAGQSPDEITVALKWMTSMHDYHERLKGED